MRAQRRVQPSVWSMVLFGGTGSNFSTQRLARQRLDVGARLEQLRIASRAVREVRLHRRHIERQRQRPHRHRRPSRLLATHPDTLTSSSISATDLYAARRTQAPCADLTAVPPWTTSTSSTRALEHLHSAHRLAAFSVILLAAGARRRPRHCPQRPASSCRPWSSTHHTPRAFCTFGLHPFCDRRNTPCAAPCCASIAPAMRTAACSLGAPSPRAPPPTSSSVGGGGGGGARRRAPSPPSTARASTLSPPRY